MVVDEPITVVNLSSKQEKTEQLTPSNTSTLQKRDEITLGFKASESTLNESKDAPFLFEPNVMDLTNRLCDLNVQDFSALDSDSEWENLVAANKFRRLEEIESEEQKIECSGIGISESELIVDLSTNSANVKVEPAVEAVSTEQQVRC